mgnify:FL=1
MNDGNTFSYGKLVEEGQRRLAAAGVEEAAVDAWLLFSYDKKVDRTWYLLNRTKAASGEEQEAYLKLIARRCERVPLQHITGEQEFMGLPFRVTPDVLIPRQDTEVLVEECLRHLAPGNIFLDLCTGSGCILVSLLHYAKGTFGTGADLSGKALAVAKGNVEANGVEARLVQGDLFEPVTGTFDLIVSNPPYIASAEIETLAPEVREHEPRMALDGTADGLFFYRRIVQESPSYLKEGGWLCMEIGYDQGAAVRQLMEARGFATVSVIKDLAGLDRVVSGCYRRNRNV